MHCSMCGARGVNKNTCPYNTKAANIDPRKHNQLGGSERIQLLVDRLTDFTVETTQTLVDEGTYDNDIHDIFGGIDYTIKNAQRAFMRALHLFINMRIKLTIEAYLHDYPDPENDINDMEMLEDTVNDVIVGDALHNQQFKNMVIQQYQLY